MRMGVVGTGKMGRALIEGVLRRQLVAPADLCVHDPEPLAVRALCESFPEARAMPDNAAVAAQSDVVLICVKPPEAVKVVAELAGESTRPLFISIAAGVTLDALQEAAGSEARLIRAMPNTPALIGAGAAAFAAGKRTTPEDARCAASLLGAVGFVAELPEKLLDAVTALSGSGPAYVYTFIEALADAGVRCGLPRETALALAAHTVTGSAAMVQQTGEHPARLRDQVTSPGGTTIAALAALERGGFRAAVFDALDAAWRRAQELGR